MEPKSIENFVPKLMLICRIASQVSKQVKEKIRVWIIDVAVSGDEEQKTDDVKKIIEISTSTWNCNDFVKRK